MKNFLRKIKLIDNFSTQIVIQKSEFMKKLKEHVDEGDIGFFSNTFDVFSSSKNEYRGHVGFDNFKIKRRKKFFDMNMNLSVAEGTYRQNGDNLIIEGEINGFSGAMIPFYVVVLIFYLIFIVGFFMTDSMPLLMMFVVVPFLLIHASFMLGMPYLMMRRSVKRMKHELEREFYFLTKP